MADNPSLLSFRMAIVRSGLLSADRIEPYFKASLPSGARPSKADVAAKLVEDGLLTPFQSRQLVRGRTDDFFINGKYKMLGLLGAGGMGKIYLCEHLLLNRLVAIKMLQTTNGPASASAIERFYREGRAVAALDHPNIVRVFDIDRIGKNPFMVLEYVDGSNLHDVVSRTGAMPVERASYYMRQAAAGLAQAHALGLIHRDIKPGNILLDRNGAVKILDLGLVKFASDSLRNDPITDRLDRDVVLGTADFMAPEQADGQLPADPRSDIYSLGCTFYFLLTGRLPFPEGTAIQKMFQHKTRAPEPLSELCPRLPEDLNRIIDKMIEKSPNDRYQSAREVIEALAPWVRGVISTPSASEMPATPSSFYRLGLSPRDEETGQFLTPDSSNNSDSLQTSKNPNLPFGHSFTDLEMEALKTPSSTSTDPKTLAQLPDNLRPPLIPYLATVAALFVTVAMIWQLTKERKQRPDGDPSDTKDAPVATKKSGIGEFDGVIIGGGGSTFISPAMSRWTKLYEERHGVRVEYQSLGSARGVDGILSRQFHFGTTEVPLTDEQLTASRQQGGEYIHIPLVLGAVVPAYNLPDVGESIAFTPPILADIYMGKIKRWNDPAIAANNPGIKLPDLPIQVVRRADSSGTTYVWTDYLSKVSAEWRSKFGAGTQVRFPVGVNVRGNNGIASYISRNIGSLGYVELTYAIQSNLNYGKVKNHEGHVVLPTPETVTAAFRYAAPKLPEDLRFNLTDALGDNSYPISGATWAVIEVDQSQNDSGRELVAFLRWLTHEGQTIAQELKYAPLPPELVKKIDAKLDMVKLPPHKSK